MCVCVFVCGLGGRDWRKSRTPEHSTPEHSLFSSFPPAQAIVKKALSVEAEDPIGNADVFDKGEPEGHAVVEATGCDLGDEDCLRKEVCPATYTDTHRYTQIHTDTHRYTNTFTHNSLSLFRLFEQFSLSLSLSLSLSRACARARARTHKGGCGQTKSKKRIFFFIHTQGVWPGQTKSKKGAVMQTMTGPKDVYDTYTRAAAHLGARILKSPSMRAFISYIY